MLLAVNPGDPGSELLGGHCLEYNPEAGATKFLVGTEQGSVVGYNSKQKRMNGGLTIYDMGVLSKHHGPVSAIQRNPIHTKFFLTVGDWCAKIWVEDGKTPVLSTSYHDAYLTGGCWSASRPGVFYLTRVDGVVQWLLLLQCHRGEGARYVGHDCGAAAAFRAAVRLLRKAGACGACAADCAAVCFAALSSSASRRVFSANLRCCQALVRPVRALRSRFFMAC